jgi:hypothetical protein
VKDTLELVRLADPLDAREVQRWWSTAELDAAPGHEVPVASSRSRRRALPVLAAAAAVAGAGIGVAAASGLLGQRASARVQRHLAEQDAGIPADLRYSADVKDARAVAVTSHGTLYLATLPDGGYCIEIVSGADQPRGAACVRGADLSGRPLEVNAPIPIDDIAPLLVGGVATGDDISAVDVRYPDGTRADVPFGLQHAWLLEVPEGEVTAVLAHGMVVTAVGADARVIRQVTVPPLHDDDPLGTAHDANQPLVVETTSSAGDFTLVREIHGRVNIADAALTIRYPDGSTARIQLEADGRFSYRIPTGRQDSFANRAGVLTVRVEGRLVATKPVISVAGWRRSHPNG